MKIGIDIDGVLTNISDYQLINGTQYFKNIYNYNGYEIKDIFNCSNRKQIVFWLKNLKYFIMNARNGASEFCFYLHNIGHEIIIISARNKILKVYTKIWLKRNNIYYDNIIFTKDKLRIIQHNDINLMIEDSPDNITVLNKEIPVICMKAPYNENINEKNIYMVSSFEEIYKIIDNIQSQKLLTKHS